MLRFFRQIRKKLMEQNKTRSYLIYALGEILLVMIGILLALQVNTWNEDRKRANLEQYLLNELKNEVAENLVLIEGDIGRNIEGLRHSLGFLDLLLNESIEQNLELADSLVAGIYEMSTFEPKSGVIDDIVNTGKLDVIKNDSLRILISNWDYQIIDINDDAEIRNIALFEQLVPFLIKNYPYVNVHEFVSVFLNSEGLSLRIWPTQKSNIAPNLAALYTLEAEGLVYNHAINQEYLLNALRLYKDYLEGLSSFIKMELGNE